MASILNKIIQLLNNKKKYQFLIIQLLLIFSALAEVTQVIILAGFINFITNFELIDKQIFWQSILIDVFDINSPQDLILIVSVIMLFIIFCCSLISLISVWVCQLYGQKLGAYFGNELFGYYLNREWEFHTINNSATLTAKIANEISRVSNGIIINFLNLNSRLILAVAMLLTVLIYSFFSSMLIITIFGLTYLIIFFLVQNKIKDNGKIITQSIAKRFKLMSEGFGGIRDTKLLGRASHFKKQFDLASSIMARKTAENSALSQGPRYITEFAAFLTLVSVVVTSLFILDLDINQILPLLSLFALSAFKLLPAFQQIYYSISSIEGYSYSLDILFDDLKNAVSGVGLDEKSDLVQNEEDIFHGSIQLKNVSFSYQTKNKLILKNINFEIEHFTKVGIVGPSGSGKSTLADLISGLLFPTEGSLRVGNVNLNKSNIRSWRKNIGFVSQRVYLADASIEENIAFGLEKEEINQSKVEECLKQSNLIDLVQTLPDGTKTLVGERGIQLSGGQCQRIGIARALYHDAPYLILDEASSSLDGITENMIMSEVAEISSQKTIIIIAHRINTVKDCDQILMLKDGQINDYGPYDDLYQRNKEFKRMVETT